MEHSQGIDPQALDTIILEAKRVAIDFRRVTGRPLGITGEIGEYEAARILGLRMADVRQSGYDAIHPDGTKVQIKSRCRLEKTRQQGVGKINLIHEWDVVVLVILDADFEPLIVHQADREAITKALLAPGSKARNERGVLSVSKFKSIGSTIWKRP